jgi:hypothetical protein
MTENGVHNSCYVSGSAAEVCLVGVCNWLTSLSEVLDKVIVCQLVRNVTHFFGNRRFFTTGVYKYRATKLCTVVPDI